MDAEDEVKGARVKFSNGHRISLRHAFPGHGRRAVSIPISGAVGQEIKRFVPALAVGLILLSSAAFRRRRRMHPPSDNLLPAWWADGAFGPHP